MTEIERMQAFSYLDGAADGLKEARNDVIEELEEIKEEIEEKQSKYTDRWIMSVTDYSYGCYKAYEETIKLIDNHISELKGENNV